MAKKPKFYTVWNGRNKGIFTSWDDCKKQIDGYEGAQYKSFESKKEAEVAFQKSYFQVIKTGQAKIVENPRISLPKPKEPAVVVDAAWNTKTGDMEYQGIDLLNGQKIFHQGPFFDGTNNIGEFLAIVHALAFLHKRNLNIPIYTDSKTAMSWIKIRRANTKLEKTSRNAELFDLIDRAEKWLKTNIWANPIRKWETKQWGENPADFGRK
jgi:ribonuclease HI